MVEREVEKENDTRRGEESQGKVNPKKNANPDADQQHSKQNDRVEEAYKNLEKRTPLSLARRQTLCVYMAD